MLEKFSTTKVHQGIRRVVKIIPSLHCDGTPRPCTFANNHGIMHKIEKLYLTSYFLILNDKNKLEKRKKIE